MTKVLMLLILHSVTPNTYATRYSLSSADEHPQVSMLQVTSLDEWAALVQSPGAFLSALTTLKLRTDKGDAEYAKVAGLYSMLVEVFGGDSMKFWKAVGDLDATKEVLGSTSPVQRGTGLLQVASLDEWAELAMESPGAFLSALTKLKLRTDKDDAKYATVAGLYTMLVDMFVGDSMKFWLAVGDLDATKEVLGSASPL
mmetsp:Transcript_7794/g.16288  ORF Transcript_7794/g.16288 Transcript_7794/m.16288 type:complete len:199 (+) Transcript_7794:83-679(+)